MLITDLGQHTIILGKLWINRHRVLLDIRLDSVVFPRDRKSEMDVRVTEISSEPERPIKILQRIRLLMDEKDFTIRSINADAFDLLTRQSKVKETQLFAISMEDIDALILAD